MEVNEIISKSPIRVFEESINGGLGRGNLGVLTSRQGVGKTACMVHLAIDKILRGQNIVHVSFGANVEHIMSWYKEVFNEIANYKKVPDVNTLYDKIRANRVMLNFSQDDAGVDTILKSLSTLMDAGSFEADAVFFDGYRLTAATEEDVKKIKQFAKDKNVEIWCSASPVKKDVEFDQYGIADTFAPYKSIIDVLVGLHYNDERNRVIMTVVQDHTKGVAHPTGVSLDPKTMLIAE